MLKRAAGTVLWAAKGMALFWGTVMTLTLVLGIGTVALAAVPGDPFRLGQVNVINNAVTTLVGSRAGGAMMLVDNNSNAAGSRALDLRTQPGRAPLTVNPDAGKAPNLNADKVDNKSVEQLGVNGYERVRVESAFDSTASKSMFAECPDGKVVVGGGVQVFPSLADPQVERAPIVVRYSAPDASGWSVIAEEIVDYGFSWWVSSTAICAAAP